jgi:hypothetical protein
MRWLSRSGLGEQPTTAQVPGLVSRARMVSSAFSEAMAARLADRWRGAARPPRAARSGEPFGSSS